MDRDKKLVEAFFDNCGCAGKLISAFGRDEKDTVVSLSIGSRTEVENVSVYSCVADGTNSDGDGRKNIVFIKNLIAIVDRKGSFIDMPRDTRTILDRHGGGVRVMIAVGSGDVGITSPENRANELMGYMFGNSA